MTTCTNSTCPYCGVGCGVTVSTNALADAVSVQGDQLHPANQGRLCVKGSALADTLGSSARLLQPQVDGEEVSWVKALDSISSRLRKTIDEYGPDSVAFYVSGQLLTEDYYVANKLMKGFIGSANIDTNSRLCMSTAVAAHKRAFGSDTVPGCYEDLELADLLVITGSNMAWTHPVVYQRIVAAKKARPSMRVVVIDPRRTATAELADLHLAITPGSDGYLFDGLLAWLISQRAIDSRYILAHTEEYLTAARASLARSSDPLAVAARCGISVDDLLTFYRWYCDTPRTVTVFSQGINQSASGVDKAGAILNCHLACGRIGKPGATPFSITGQPNAMGGREVGGLANQLAAHMDIDNPQHRDLLSRFWNSDRIVAKPGLKAVDLFDAMADGRIRFVWIMATNPLVSLPDANRVRQALAACDCVVVSDCVDDTDTLRLADIKLPAAGWGEKDGTVTNSERCISRQRAFLPMPGQARPDWWAVCEVAKRLGFGQAFNFENAAAIFREHAALSAFENKGRRDFDIGGLARLKDAEYESLEPVQWPVPSSRRQGTARMFVDGRFFTPNGRACFVDVAPKPAAQRCDAQHPFMLNTGRIRDQWHTMTRTGRSARLLQHIAEPFVELHEADMHSLGVSEDQLVRVHNSLGECVVRVRRQDGQTPGTVFMPIHWNDCFASAARVDSLVAAVCDPISGQPAFKQTPVAISPLRSDWQALLLSRTPLPLPKNHYWCRREQAGWQVLLMAGARRPTLAELKQLWASEVDTWAELDDEQGGDIRLVGYAGGEVRCWLSLRHDRPEVDESWLLTSLVDVELNARELARGMPATGGDRSPLICSCHQVRTARLQTAIAEGHCTVEALGACTRAGTNCGSCIPELKQLLVVGAVA